MKTVTPHEATLYFRRNESETEKMPLPDISAFATELGPIFQKTLYFFLIKKYYIDKGVLGFDIDISDVLENLI